MCHSYANDHERSSVHGRYVRLHGGSNFSIIVFLFIFSFFFLLFLDHSITWRALYVKCYCWQAYLFFIIIVTIHLNEANDKKNKQTGVSQIQIGFVSIWIRICLVRLKSFQFFAWHYSCVVHVHHCQSEASAKESNQSTSSINLFFAVILPHMRSLNWVINIESEFICLCGHVMVWRLAVDLNYVIGTIHFCCHLMLLRILRDVAFHIVIDK